jgi:hypothetical protein
MTAEPMARLKTITRILLISNPYLTLMAPIDFLTFGRNGQI